MVTTVTRIGERRLGVWETPFRASKDCCDFLNASHLGVFGCLPRTWLARKRLWVVETVVAGTAVGQCTPAGGKVSCQVNCYVWARRGAP